MNKKCTRKSLLVPRRFNDYMISQATLHNPTQRLQWGPITAAMIEWGNCTIWEVATWGKHPWALSYALKKRENT